MGWAFAGAAILVVIFFVLRRRIEIDGHRRPSMKLLLPKPTIE
jgi:hypothetical protein